MSNYPNVVSKRASELLESGDQPTMQFAKNKAQHEFNEMIYNMEKVNEHKVSIGEPVGNIENVIKLISNIEVEQYIQVVMQASHVANNLPK